MVATSKAASVASKEAARHATLAVVSASEFDPFTAREIDIDILKYE